MGVMRRGGTNLQSRECQTSYVWAITKRLVILSAVIGGGAAASDDSFAVPEHFQDIVVWGGLTLPTAVRFAPDGRVFIAEKSGIIKVFDDLQDITPTVFADLSAQVQDFNDRGLNGFAIDPEFPARPYVYAFFAVDAPPGLTPPVYNDDCDVDDCIVLSRLVRLTASGNTAISQEILLESEWWCEISAHHSAGNLAFGLDGYLYVSHGDGGTANYTDWGQTNGCPGDPPQEGGSMRSQDLLTPADAISFDGTILRIDPDTGAAAPDNALVGGSVADDDQIIAYGLRNPFRFAFDRNTGRLWIGDVGWNDFEEINAIESVTGTPPNFGWPCYEGIPRQPSYDAADLPVCESLYASGPVAGPYFTYNHNLTTSAVTGIVVYRGTNFPAAYDGALFFSDYGKRFIRVMMPAANGLPDTAAVSDFVLNNVAAVDLQIGPEGALYYVDIVAGTVSRVSYFFVNTPPNAVIDANKTFGPLPLTIDFSAAGSTDPDDDAMTYAWDLDGDGQFDNSTQIAPTATYVSSGAITVGLRVTNSQDAGASKTLVVHPGNTPPSPTITAPAPGTLFQAGETIVFSGSASDAESGAIGAAGLSWLVTLKHCAVGNPSDCHSHFAQQLNGVAGGTITMPDHEYPAFLEMRLTATDPQGLSAETTTEIHPETTTISFTSNPSGLKIAVYSSVVATPFTRTVMVGAQTTISAVTPQTIGATTHTFSSWSDGGAQTHTITAGSLPQTFTATFSSAPALATWNSWDVIPQAGTPQATVVSNTGVSTTIDFYESSDDTGVARGTLFPAYNAGVHTDAFNNVENIRNYTDGVSDYPYVGKSTVDRGSDTGEGNAHEPLTARDITVHPPNNDHNVVVAFKVPKNGTYTVSNLGVRRVESLGDDARLHLYDPAGAELANLNATSNQDWVTSGTIYTLSNLIAGQYISFGLDRNGAWDFEAAEMSWTIIAKEDAPPPSPTLTLTASPLTIVAGATATLSWSSTNTTSCSASSGWSGSKALSGSQVVTPAVSTTYVLSCTGAGGAISRQVNIAVTAPATLTLTASPLTIVAGTTATLSWSSTNTTSCTASNGWTGAKAVSGSQVVTPAVSTTYALSCTGAGGAVTRQVSVAVTAPAATCTLRSDPALITQGKQSILSWKTTNASAFSINQGIGSVVPVTSGSRSVTPTATTTYTGTVIGSGGSGQCTTSIKVTVLPFASQATWNSWDVTPRSGIPQATVKAGNGVTASVDFYKSANNLGIARGTPFAAYRPGSHADSFNHVENFRAAANSASAYPYVGKSTVNRGADTGEGNAQAPLGVRDITLYPPNNSHNTVVAFRVPQNGTYTVSNLGVRRVAAQGNNARLHLYSPAGAELGNLIATSNQDWVTKPSAYSLPNLTTGQYISFGVDQNGNGAFDATEISWRISGPGRDDLLVSFGAEGLWQFMNSADWLRVVSLSPLAVTTGDLDGDLKDEAIASFPGIGLWARYNNATWVRLHTAASVRFVAGDVDGNGKDDLAVDFGASGTLDSLQQRHLGEGASFFRPRYQGWRFRRQRQGRGGCRPRC